MPYPTGSAMSEEQLKAADAEAVKEEDEEVEVEEISEDDLEGVTGGAKVGEPAGLGIKKAAPTCCGHDPCLGPLAGCDTEPTAD